VLRTALDRIGIFDDPPAGADVIRNGSCIVHIPSYRKLLGANMREASSPV